MSESELKRTVEDYLTILQSQGKLFFLRLNSGDFIEVRGETRRRIKGCPKGTADLMVITNNGRFDAPNKFYPVVYFLELKTPKGKVSLEQVEFGKMVEIHGCIYLVIRKLEELQGYI